MAAYIPQNYVSSTNHIKTYGLSLTGKNKIEMIKLPLPFWLYWDLRENTVQFPIISYLT